MLNDIKERIDNNWLVIPENTRKLNLGISFLKALNAVSKNKENMNPKNDVTLDGGISNFSNITSERIGYNKRKNSVRRNDKFFLSFHQYYP